MKQNLQIGQLHEVELLPNQNKLKQPVCRIEGLIGFIHRDNKEEVKVGEKWHVSISEIHDRYIIVMPVYISKTVEETEDEKILLLSQFKTERKAKEKKTRKYPFCSFDQLKGLKIG